MERGERFHRMHRLFKAGKCLPLSHFMEDLGISRAQCRRDIEYLQDRYEAPLIWDAERRGYRYDLSQKGAEKFELPGLWFNASEIYALLAMHSMLGEIGPGLVSDQVNPLMKRLEKMLSESGHPPEQLRNRIRIHNISARLAEPLHFATAAQAVLQRLQVQMTHYNRGTDKITKRVVSPQRLIFYRGNWYLDGWCHLRKGIRSFSVDALRHLVLLDDKAIEIDDARLDSYFAASYGIFGGEPTDKAVLRFSPVRARWVQQEQWHPQQAGRMESDGSYVLEIPYANPTELIMDILKHGAEVEVLSPPSLRQLVAEQLRASLKRYG